MRRPPLVVDITAVKRKPGSRERFARSLPKIAELDMGLAGAQVHATAIRVDLQLEFRGDDLVVDGVVTIDWVGPCRRCLEDQTGTEPVSVQEIFEATPTDGETYQLGDEDVDLEPMVRETTLLSLPVTPLCAEDCAGPDPDRFPTTVAADPEPSDPNGSETATEAAGDPRWAALSELNFGAEADGGGTD